MTDYDLQLGQVLRYSSIKENKAEYIDGFLNFRRLAEYSGAGSFQLEKGINTPAPVVGLDKIARRPAILVASSPHRRGSAETPWQDFFDTNMGCIRYFGDNKDPGKDPAQAPGNKALLAAFRQAHSHDPRERVQTPPLLFFKRVSHKGKTKGFPQFQGFGVVRNVELVTQWDNKLARSFTNYAFDFTVFNLEAEHDLFPWSWIMSRRNPALSLTATHKTAPKSWQRWIREGSNSLDSLRRRVSKLQIAPAHEQRPQKGSEICGVLDLVYGYYADKKHEFEALAEVIAARVLDAGAGNYQRGWITSAGGDGGIDFVGSLRIGREFSSVDIAVLGQAKCEAPATVTSGNHIARTVARLRRGCVGVYVTTSYFSAKVQQEVIEDRFPIVLIHGKRVAKEVIEIVHGDPKYPTVTSFLDELSKEYPDRVQQRNLSEFVG